jgi:predicted nuclease of predicted toxin-antitoxin system
LAASLSFAGHGFPSNSSSACSRTAGPGAKDDQVLDRAIRTGAIILTCDRDFGQWVRQM